MANDRDKKRPGTMSGEDRDAAALARIRARIDTPHGGVPILAIDSDDFTPVGVAIEHLEKAIDLTDRERLLIELGWKHSANQEMRSRKRVELTEGGQLRAELDEVSRVVATHAERITDATGKSGDNGKLGELKRRVDAWTSKTWWLVTALLGALGTAAIKLVLVTRAFDAVESRSVANAEQLKILQAQVMTLQAAAISRGARRSSEHPPGPVLEPRAEAEGSSP